MSGRPLKFIGLTLTGWVAARTVMLWPAVEPRANVPRLLIPNAIAAPRPVQRLPSIAPMVSLAPASRSARPTLPASPMIIREPKAVIFSGQKPAPSKLTTQPAQIGGEYPPLTQSIPLLITPLPGRPSATRRWSGSAWLALRNGTGAAASLGGGQLGGSQAGARIAYAFDNAGRIAAVGRVTSPLHGVGREASIGLEWKPTRLPVRLVIERRFALDRGKGGPAVGVIAGTGPAPLALGFELETYGQAGVIRRARTEPFADGAAHVTRRVASAEGVTIDVGAGAWGGAQRDAQRLDLGPSIGIRLPIANRGVRATIDCGIM